MTQNILDIIDGDLQNLRLTHDSLEKELETVQSEIKKLEKVRKILTDEPQKRQARQTTTPAKRSSLRVLKTVLDAMKQHPEQEWTTDTIMDTTQLGGSTISTAVRDLRNDGLIDLVRRGGKTGAKAYYKVAMTNASVT